MHTNRSALVVLALVAALTLPTSMQAQQQAPDPATVAAEEAARQAAVAAGPRFDPSAYGFGGCVNEPPADERISATVPPGFVAQPGMNGGPGWQVSAPRAPIQPGDQAMITLRDKVGTANRMVYADVYGPDGAFARAGSALFGSAQAKLAYPADFRAAAATVTGVYSVIWRDTITDRFLACDGFVVGP